MFNRILLSSCALAASLLFVGACDRAPTPDPQPEPVAAAPAAAAPASAKPVPAEPEAAPSPQRASIDGLTPSKAKAFASAAPDSLGTRQDELGLGPGNPAPDFTAADVHGKPVTLEGLLTKGAVLLVFYRGGWCPYCNYQVHQLAEAYPRFKAAGVRPVMVSVDKPSGAKAVRQTYEVPFPLLSDPDLKAHDAFGITLHLDDARVAQLKGWNLDLEAWSARDHHKLAVPSIFLVDAGGTIRWAHVAKDYKIRPDAEQLLEVVAAAKLAPAAAP